VSIEVEEEKDSRKHDWQPLITFVVTTTKNCEALKKSKIHGISPKSYINIRNMEKYVRQFY
jgi:hypothetical protein